MRSMGEVNETLSKPSNSMIINYGNKSLHVFSYNATYNV